MCAPGGRGCKLGKDHDPWAHGRGLGRGAVAFGRGRHVRREYRAHGARELDQACHGGNSGGQARPRKERGRPHREIKKNINLSLESFTIAEKKLNEATQSTKDLDSKIQEILEDAKIQAEVVSKSMIEKNQNTIISKEKNSLERIKQIELATIQTIKSQASIKLDEILMNYFENMPNKTKTNILKSKIEELSNFQ